MKPTHFTKFLPLALISAASLSLVSATLAQDAEKAAVVYPVVKTKTGYFQSSNGSGGSFVETIALNSAKSRTFSTVFTRSSDSATRSETRSVTVNDDKSRTVDYSSFGYNATAPFTSHKTITPEKQGQFVGQGTYSTPEGDTGTLTTLETKAETVNVVSAVYSSPAKGITNDIRLEDDGLGFVTVKTIELDPSGKVTTDVHTRFFTGK